MTALTEIRDSIKDRMRLWVEYSSAEAVGDGESTRFHLPDYPIVDGSVVCTIGDDEDVPGAPLVEGLTEDFVVDYETGWFSFETPPDEGHKIAWTWQMAPLPDEMLLGLINAGVDYLFPSFYATGKIDRTQSTSFGTFEYELPAGCFTVEDVFLQPDTNSRWVRANNWDIYEDLDDSTPPEPVQMLTFPYDPGDCGMRIHYITRPDHFTDFDANPAETLEATVGYPARAVESIVCFVVWKIIGITTARRARDDRAHNQQGENSVTMMDLGRVWQQTKLDLDLTTGALAENPWRMWSVI